jgi:serine/threonine-protein kinase
MSELPPASLVDLLARLELALPAEVECMAPRVRRLARGLPAFEQVWVDALAQARRLTNFQASAIHAGRGEPLAIGSFVLYEPLEELGYATVYRARELRTRRFARLLVLAAAPAQVETWSKRLAELVRRTARADHPALLHVESFGVAGERFWIAGRHVEAWSLAEWLIHRGRMPPAAVHDLARRMAEALAIAEQAGVMHGDLGPRQVAIGRKGELLLSLPGVRPIVRPTEGYADAGLVPETYDYVAPERIASGSLPDVASDLYACGALWWHLLAGRAPIPGASGLAKMRAVQVSRVPPIREIAPDTPPQLVAAIDRCLARDPRARPASFAELAGIVGETRSHARAALARCALFPGQRVAPLPALVQLRAWSPRLAAAAAAIVLLVGVASWPLWGERLTSHAPPAKRAATKLAAKAKNDPGPAKNVGTPIPAEPAENVVVKASYNEPTPTEVDDPNVLRIGPRVKASELKLKPGIKVVAAKGTSTVEVPADGWTITAEEVTFENLEFVWPSAESDPASEAPIAAISCQAKRVKFHGCRWKGADAPDRTAIVWQMADGGDERLLTGELELTNCVFDGVAAALWVDPHHTMLVDVQNTLHLGPGPLVTLASAPRPESRVLIALKRFTLRDAAGLVECRLHDLPASPGKLEISAEDCAFVPTGSMALLRFIGDEDPTEILQTLEWTGRGSMLAERSPLAVWQTSGGGQRAAAEDTVQVAGLVRSRLEFAGPKSGGRAAARLVHWQGPLESDAPPGIGEASATRR